MDIKLTTSLISLGLTEKEAKLYLTLLEIGPNPVSSVARKADITRTTAYAALENLRAKGLVSTIEEKGIQQFAPVEPKKLEEYAKREQEKAQQNYGLIKDIIPELKSLTGDLVITPKVKFYEGIEGIKTIFNDSIDTLKELPKKDRVKYAYSSAPEVSSDLRKFLDEYIAERKKHDILIKGIFAQSERGLQYEKNKKKNLAEVRFMPYGLSLPFESEISIYAHKVSVTSLKNDRLHGVIIESPEIAGTHRAIFELSWKSSEASGPKNF